jgi:hypothetical protein
MKNSSNHRKDGMRPEYDFASMKGGVRGKHYGPYRKGTNVVLIEPDVAKAFPTEGAVNEALRGVLDSARAARKTGSHGGSALRTQPSGPKRRVRRSNR